MVIALGIHLFPFRTEKLSPTTSMVLRKSGRVDSRRFLGVRAKVLREGSRFSFESAFFVSDSPFFRDRVFGWRVCPPRCYVRFACNARIVMSQDPAGARIGGDKWSDRSVEKARLGSEFYTGSIEDTRCTTRGLRKAVQWRGLTSLTNGRHIVRQAGIQNPGFRKMHSRSGRVW